MNRSLRSIAAALSLLLFAVSLNAGTPPKKIVPFQALKLGANGLCLQNAARLWLAQWETVAPESVFAIKAKASFLVDVPGGPTVTFRVDTIKGPVSGSMKVKLTRSYKTTDRSDWFWTVVPESTVMVDVNKVAPGMFEGADLASWSAYSNGDPLQASLDASDKVQGATSLKIVVPAVVPSNCQVMFVGPTLKAWAKTKIVFWAKSDRPSRVGLQLVKNTSPWNSYFWDTADLTTAWKRYEFNIELTPTTIGGNMTVGSDTRFRIALDGEAAGGETIHVDSLALTDGSRFASIATPTATTDSTSRETFWLEPVIYNRAKIQPSTTGPRLFLNYKKATKTQATFSAQAIDAIPFWLVNWVDSLSTEAPKQ